MYRYVFFILTILFTSCNNDGTVVHNQTDDGVNRQTELNYCTNPEVELCYPIEEIYYDFSDNQAVSQTFYKFNRLWSEGGDHDDSLGVLDLYSFNNEYLLAVPAEIVNSESSNNSVLIYGQDGLATGEGLVLSFLDGNFSESCITNFVFQNINGDTLSVEWENSNNDCETFSSDVCLDIEDDALKYSTFEVIKEFDFTHSNCITSIYGGEVASSGFSVNLSENAVYVTSNAGEYVFESLSNLSDLPEYLTELYTQPPITRTRDSLLVLSSNSFTNLANVVWNNSQGRYLQNTVNSDVVTKKYYYSQEYDSIVQTTLIDPDSNPITGDLILIDYNQIIQRNFSVPDSLDNGDPVKTKRNLSYKTNYTYVPYDGLYWRESADCNDNYQQDDEEIVLFDNYVNPYGTNPKSFESWCLMDACIDGSSVSEEDCCINNNNNWYYAGCTDMIFSYEDDNAQSCCNRTDYSWDGNACVDLSSSSSQDCLGIYENNICEIKNWFDQDDAGCYDENFDLLNTLWSNDILFSINQDNMCSSFCDKGGDVTTMDEFCWSYYDGGITYPENGGESVQGSDRLTGHCLEHSIDTMLSSSGSEYPLTFCDVGNNLNDSDNPEFFYDENSDGLYTTSANSQEPFEDRNCNGVLDGSGYNTNYNDLLPGDSVDFDGDGNYDFLCDDSYYLSNDDGVDYCDRGNGQWDSSEECYCSPDADLDSCDSCGYEDLFVKSSAPDVLLVTYADNSNPEAVLDAYPMRNYEDTGIDGCLDEFEDGEGGCLCEIKQNDYSDDDSLPDCEVFLVQSYNEINKSFNQLWRIWNNQPSGEVIVSEFDIGKSEFSPFNYGECSNGFSGSYEDCCNYYSCSWNNETDVCDWTADSCTADQKFCLDDIVNECNDDDDCGGGACTLEKWVIDIDPNNDNYWSSNGCYYTGICDPLDSESDAPPFDNNKTQLNGKWDYQTEDSYERSHWWSNQDGSNIISEQEYLENIGSYPGYNPYVGLPDYIVTKELGYDSGEVGGDTLTIIKNELRSVPIVSSHPIINTRNSILSHQVIDQANYSNGNGEFCEIASELCNSEKNYNDCIESLAETNNLECSGSLLVDCNVNDDDMCMGLSGCTWVEDEQDLGGCMFYPGEAYCANENDLNNNNLCDEFEDIFQNSSCAIDYSECVESLESQMSLEFVQDVLSDFNIVKTVFCVEYNTNDICVNYDYDYMLFTKAEDDNYIIKMTHPYYHFQGVNTQPIDSYDFQDGFWQNISLKPDTLLHTRDGDVVDGDYVYSSEHMYSEFGDYFIEKEYDVSSGIAELEYPIYNPSLYNPNCSNLEDKDLCTQESNCAWNEPPDYDPFLFDAFCDNFKSSLIEDCLIVTRIVKTTALGPAQGFQLRTTTYLKPDYKIVKETLEISWDTYPWLNSLWHYVSGIEYKNGSVNLDLNATPDNFLVNYQTIDAEDLEVMQDFNFNPFRITNTMGLLRFEYPIE